MDSQHLNCWRCANEEGSSFLCENCVVALRTTSGHFPCRGACERIFCNGPNFTCPDCAVTATQVSSLVAPCRGACERIFCNGPNFTCPDCAVPAEARNNPES